jgi:4-amino-4-deoxy-L-arabinose transferase-like glycosyltransferase
MAAWLKASSHWLVVLIVLSVLARLASAFYLGDRVEEMPGTFDQISYHLLAQRVLAGHGFSFEQPWWPVTAAGAPTAHWSFLYTFFLVLVYGIFGPHPLAARVIQAVIFGILQPYLTYRIGTQVFGRAAELLAALLAVVYAYFIYYGGTLMTEPFYILAILGTFEISIRLGRGVMNEKHVGSWLALGLVMGLAVLLRQVFLLMVPFILLWVGWAASRRKNGFSLFKLVLPLVVIVLMVLPFSLYNYSRFDSMVLLNTNSGYAFFWGNHPYYGTDFIPILPSEKYVELIPVELRGLDEAALDKALLSRALQFILADPGRYLLLSLGRISDFFMFWPSTDSGTISNISRVASFGILWTFMLIGLIAAVRNAFIKGAEKLASPVILLFLFILVYSGVHILTWTLVRYRLPVDAIGLLFAGYLLLELGRRFFHVGRQPVSSAGLHPPQTEIRR